MAYYAFEQLRFVGLSSDLSIQILQLDLFPSEVVAKPAKLGSIILFASFVFEVVVLDPLPDEVRLLFQSGAHLAVSVSSLGV